MREPQGSGRHRRASFLGRGCEHPGLGDWDWEAGPASASISPQMHKRERTCKDYIKVRPGRPAG